jgi:hypothetical protein
MKRFLIAATAALTLAIPVAPAGAAPDCNTTKTCAVEEFVEQVLCLGNLDCPQRSARD